MWERLRGNCGGEKREREGGREGGKEGGREQKCASVSKGKVKI